MVKVFRILFLWYSLFVGFFLMYSGVAIGLKDRDDGMLWFTLLAILPLTWSTIKAVRTTL